MRSVLFGGLFLFAVASVGLGVACAVPNIDEDLPTDGTPPADPVPDSSFSSSGSSGTSGTSGGATDAAPVDATPADTGVDAGPVLDGTYSGTYTNNRSAFGCNFANAGNLNAIFTTSGTDLTTTANVTGLEIRDQDCNLVDKANGTAGSSAVANAAGTFTGTWKVNVQTYGGQLDLPFTAKVSGKTVTGTWTCAGCSGGFTISKP